MPFVCRPAARQIARVASAAIALTLSACGDAPPSHADADSPARRATGDSAAAVPSAAPSSLTRQVAGEQAQSGTPSPRYELVLLDEGVVHQDQDQLDPRQGKGYASLHAFIYAPGRPRSGSPVASIKPVCTSSVRCEYLPPRKAGIAERFVISVDQEALVQLSVDEDVVVVTARALSLARAATVTVELSVEGQAPIRKRIVYGADPG
jgi:hypothetical protein